MKVGDFVSEGAGSFGIVLTCGPVAFDVVWVGGSTTRYRHDVRHVWVVDSSEQSPIDRRHLISEAADARSERARGARVRRGTVSPSR